MNKLYVYTVFKSEYILNMENNIIVVDILVFWTSKKKTIELHVEWDVGIFLDYFMISNRNVKSRIIVVAVECTYILYIH